MKKLLGSTLVALAFSAPAFASTSFDKLQELSQAELGKLAHDIASAASYRGVTPAEPLGISGFDVGLELTSTRMEQADIWKKAGSDNATLYLPKLHVHKGLPFDIDVGASIALVPGSDIKLLGAEIKYALVGGNTALPAVAIRAAATRLTGAPELDLDTRSLELTLSKGFVNLTPYAGIGKVWGTLTPNVASLKRESPSMNKVFAGLNFSLGLANLTAEVDRTGDNQSASVKLGLRW